MEEKEEEKEKRLGRKEIYVGVGVNKVTGLTPLPTSSCLLFTAILISTINFQIDQSSSIALFLSPSFISLSHFTPSIPPAQLNPECNASARVVDPPEIGSPPSDPDRRFRAETLTNNSRRIAVSTAPKAVYGPKALVLLVSRVGAAAVC